MTDRTRPRAGNEDRVSISSQEDHHPTKKSRDSSHQWGIDAPGSGTIKSLMDIDFDTEDPGNSRLHDNQFAAGNVEPGGQNGQHGFPVSSLMDVHVLQRSQPPSLRPADMGVAQGPGAGLPPGSVLPYMLTLPAGGGAAHPSPACMPALNYQYPFTSAVTPLMPLASAQCPPSLAGLQQPSLLGQPAPVALDKFPAMAQLPGQEGVIPSLLDLPLMGGRPAHSEPQALLSGLPGMPGEAEFEQLMERLCTSVRTRLPMCCVSPVKALETALQRCRLPRGTRKYKQQEKGLPMVCKLSVNNLVIGAGIGDTTRAADAKAYTRALRLLRETAFEDILFGMPLRDEITDLMTNLPQRQPSSPKPHRRFVVLEDRKPGLGSNSFYILMLSAQFSDRKITLSTDREDNGRCCVKVLLDDEEIATLSGENEMELKRTVSNMALDKLKSTCPVIEVISTNETWKNTIQRNLRSKLEENISSIESHISEPRSCDEPIILSMSKLGDKVPATSLSSKELEELFCQILDTYAEQKIINPLVIAPLKARSQRLLLFRLARQRSLCTETIRLSANEFYDLSLISVVRRRVDAEVLLPILQTVEDNRTEQFQLHPAVKLEEEDVESNRETIEEPATSTETV